MAGSYSTQGTSAIMILYMAIMMGCPNVIVQLLCTSSHPFSIHHHSLQYPKNGMVPEKIMDNCNIFVTLQTIG